MKNWLKKQATEFTAWIGAALVIFAFIAPRWLFITLGVLLIAIDDERAKAWVARVSPRFALWLDDWSRPDNNL